MAKIPSLPEGMTASHFGHNVMAWGTGNEAAIARMATLTAEQLREAGITAEMAQNWLSFYQEVIRETPTNPSARGRARLMEYTLSLFKESN